MKIRKIRLWNVAGYKSVTWDRLQPDLNFLIGRNGAGKSTILQALSQSLNYLSGRRTEDLLARTYPTGEIEIEISTAKSPWRIPFRKIRASQGHKHSEYPFKVLQFVENRQPKNTVGDVRAELRQHPTSRYPNAISELKFLLESNESDRRLAAQVLDICKEITASGSAGDWEWIWRAIKERSPLKARPMSCGQFDIVAVSLDLVKLKNSLQNGEEPVFILLDNPETYLHPACQEPILKLFREMFPQAQIFVSSHSLKLLCHREPKAVFWLSRDSQDESGGVNIQSIRELRQGSKFAFFELYGDDLSSAVLALLHAFEGPEYYRFLCDCALPPKTVSRNTPGEDKQMQEIRRQLDGYPKQWAILDYGAGSGDLLAALLTWNETDNRTIYVAISADETTYLRKRIDDAKAWGKISPASKLVNNLSEAPSDCDVVVLCNVCHEIPLPALPKLLARLLTHHLRQSESSKIVIHELETLLVGEVRFVMWAPHDYEQILHAVKGVRVRLVRRDLPGDVPLNTTIISLTPDQAALGDLSELLIKRFWEHLPAKKDECLAEIEKLSKRSSLRSSGLEEALRQRRVAFLAAQVANICLLERQSMAESTDM